MSEKRIRCVVTRYAVVDDKIAETTAEETTTFELLRPLPPYRLVAGERVYVSPPESEPIYVYLGNSAASASAEKLLAAAREGRGWSAQAGSPPTYFSCKRERWGATCCPGGRCEAGWGGRSYPNIYVSAEAILEALEGER